MDEPKARVALGAWSRMLAGGLVSLVSDADVLDRAIDIAVKTRHPLADCLYLAVAANLEVELVTADARLYDRGSKVARVVFLGHERSGRPGTGVAAGRPPPGNTRPPSRPDLRCRRAGVPPVRRVLHG